MKALRCCLIGAMTVSVLAAAGCSCGASAPEPAVIVREEKEEGPADPHAEAWVEGDREVGDSVLHAPADYVGTVAVKVPRYAKRVLGVAQVQAEVRQFWALDDRYPRSIEELVEWRGQPLPELPKHMAYSYDPATGRLEAAPTE